MFNIRISSRLKPKLQKLIDSYGGIKKYSTSKNILVQSVRRWLSGERSFSFYVLKEISKLEKGEILDILNGETITYERSQYNYKFNKNISLFETNLLGWLLSEGSIEKGNRISISQKSKQCLINIKNKLKKELGVDSTIEKDKEAWKLRISNAAFSSYLQWRYKLTKGKKSNIVRVPLAIFNLTDKHKFSFLAGYIEGDGCFSYYWRTNRRKKYKVPRIFITSSSFKGIKDLKKLYTSLDIFSKINNDVKHNNPKWNQLYKLNVLKIRDCIKLAYNIFPYLQSSGKKNKLKEIFKDKEIFNCARIKNNKLLINLVDYLGLKRKQLPDYFKNNLDYEAAKTTINGWINGYYSIPVSVILHCCDVLNKNYFEVLPEEFSFVVGSESKVTIKNMKSGKELCKLL